MSLRHDRDESHIGNLKKKNSNSPTSQSRNANHRLTPSKRAKVEIHRYIKSKICDIHCGDNKNTEGTIYSREEALVQIRCIHRYALKKYSTLL